MSAGGDVDQARHLRIVAGLRDYDASPFEWPTENRLPVPVRAGRAS